MSANGERAQSIPSANRSLWCILEGRLNQTGRVEEKRAEPLTDRGIRLTRHNFIVCGFQPYISAFTFSQHRGGVILRQGDVTADICFKRYNAVTDSEMWRVTFTDMTLFLSDLARAARQRHDLQIKEDGVHDTQKV